MNTQTRNQQGALTPQQLIADFLEMLNKESFDQARKMLADDFTFAGVMGNRNGADAYMADMKKMKLKYEVRKVFTAEDDICLYLEFILDGKRLPAFSWYHVDAGKIKSLQVIFDPRPLLESPHKN